MTTPESGFTVDGGPDTGRFSVRTIAAWALVGYAALHLFFAFFDWLLPGDGPFTTRSATSDLANPFIMAMPVIAVLIAAHLSPVLRPAKLIAAVALVEFAVSLVFGLFALLIGVGAVVDGSVRNANDAFDSLRYFVMGVAALALITVGAWVTFRTFTRVGGSLPVNFGTRSSAPPPAPPAA